MNEMCMITDIIATREKKGNYIVPGKTDIIRRNRRLSKLNRIRNGSKIVRVLLSFNEKVFYRIYEYFFGYYMNPVIRLFQFRNIGKAGRLFR
jgi:hypothetical protein